MERNDKIWMSIAIALLFILINCYFATRNYENKFDYIECKHENIENNLNKIIKEVEKITKELNQFNVDFKLLENKYDEVDSRTSYLEESQMCIDELL